jgi:sulfate-transporting ATPase
MTALLATQFFSQTTVQFALIGVATGSLYALVALGIVIAYRASGVINFAGSTLGAISSYVFYSMRDHHGVPTYIALPVALALGGAVGAATQVVIMGGLRKVSLLGKLIATLSLLAFAEGLIGLVFPAQNLDYPAAILPTAPVTVVGHVVLPEDRLILIGIVLAITVALRAFYSSTTFGLATSAVAESRRVASASGWSPNGIELFNFALAGVLNATAAIFLAPIIGVKVAVLVLVILPALAAALVGNFSSFTLTVAAALGIGVLSAELGVFSGSIASALGTDSTTLTGLPDTVPLLIIVIFTALSGRARLQRSEALAHLPLPGPGRVNRRLMLLGVVVTVVLIFNVSPVWDASFFVTFQWAILVLSVVVVSGYAGQLSLCQYALAGFGAWVAARLVSTQGWPFEAALVTAVLATVPVGLIVALPALRTRGVNLAVATLALASMINAAIFNNGPLTGGFFGTVVTPPHVFGWSIDPIAYPDRYAAFSFGALILSGLCVANLRRGRSGRRLLAVRANERAAASLGVGVYGAKLYAFAVSSGIAALAGVLLGFQNQNVQFVNFDIFGSINAVLYAVVGGIGWASGSIIGALNAPGALPAQIIDTLLGGVGNLYSWLLIVAGLLVVVTLRAAPDGVAALQTAQWAAFTRRFRTPKPPVEPRPQPRPRRTPATLEVSEVTVRFGGVVAVDGVSFMVAPGEIVGLIGPNGAGKTTLVDVITGFTKQVQGSVRLDGRSVEGWSPERRSREGIARSWQAVELFEEMSVRENLLVAADEKRFLPLLTDLVWPGRARPTDSMLEVVREFELEAHLEERPSGLSHGTARLAGIARAMVTEPAVLLLDEPAAGLSSHEGTEFGIALREMVRRRGVGVLIIEHDVNLLLSICDRIVCLDFGRKIAEGTPAVISTDEAVIRAYLGDATAAGAAREPASP